MEQSERGGEKEEGRAGRGRGRSCRALWACGEDLGFYSRGTREPWEGREQERASPICRGGPSARL